MAGACFDQVAASSYPIPMSPIGAKPSDLADPLYRIRVDADLPPDQPMFVSGVLGQPCPCRFHPHAMEGKNLLI